MQITTVNGAIDQALAEEMRRDARVLMFGEGVATQRRDAARRVRRRTRAQHAARRRRSSPAPPPGRPRWGCGRSSTCCSRPSSRWRWTPSSTAPASCATCRAASSIPDGGDGKTGSGWSVGGQHNHNLEAMFVHAPGLKIVMPSNAADAKGLLKAAIRDDNPVLFFNDLALGYTPARCPRTSTSCRSARRRCCARGRDVTLVSYAKTVGVCLQAADALAARDIDAEVIDLRCLKPLDEATLLASVRKTGRMVVVHEAAAPCGVGAEVAAIVAEKAWRALKAPLRRLTGPDAPAAASWVLEQAAVPTPARSKRRCWNSSASPRRP